jgi:hypothetical protein
MKEKLLALLTAKFAGVRKDGLAQLAGALSLQAGNDEEATAIIEKLTEDKVNEFITDWRRDVDKEVSDGNKTFENNLKKKYDLVEKGKNPNPGKQDDPPKPGTDDKTPEWAKSLIETNQKLTERLNNIEGQKTTETRLQQLQSKFKDKNLPSSLTAKMEKDFKRMNFESDEEFGEYLEEVESDITTFNQELADKGLSDSKPPIMGAKNKDNVSSAVKDYVDSKGDESKADVGGKEL